MDQQTLTLLLTIFVAVAAVALLIQMAMMVGLFLVARKLQAQVTAVLPQVMAVIPQVQGVIAVTKRTIENVEKHIEKIGASSNAILDVTKGQVSKIDELLNDTTRRAKVQIERAEMMLDDTMGRTQETVSIVQRTVLRPIREMNGVLAGIRTSLLHLSRARRATVDHATSDEEMFI